MTKNVCSSSIQKRKLHPTVNAATDFTYTFPDVYMLKYFEGVLPRTGLEGPEWK